MSKPDFLVSRRDFIKGAGCAAIGIAAGLPVLAEETATTPVVKSRVVLIRDQGVIDSNGKANAALVEKMLDDAMVALFEKATPQECWRQIIKPNDIVGIKTNVWKYLPTPPEVEQVLVKRVVEVGVARRMSLSMTAA